MKIVAGNFPATAGTIRIEGQEVHFSQPIDARRNGIEIVYQDLAHCDNLTAAANVFLGRELKKRLGPLRYLDHKAMFQRAGELFTDLPRRRRPLR